MARRAKTEEGRPIERHWIALGLDQPFAEKGWDTPEVKASFYHGKAAALGFLKVFGVGEPEFSRPSPQDLPFLHPGASALLTLNGKVLGFVGELHPKAAKALDLGAAPPVVLELDLEAVFDAKGKGQRQAVEPRRFPTSQRDVAFLADDARTHADFEAAIGKFKRR